MKRTFVVAACAVFSLLLTSSVFAATFFVPPDRDLIRRADAIVVGTVLGSYTQLTPAGGIETVTTLTVEETLKGADLGSQVTIHEAGGAFGDRITVIPGMPRFTDGQRVVALLARTPQHTFAIAELVLGKFTFVTDTAGRRLLVRDEGEIVGWEPDFTPHVERQRAAEPFLAYVRAEARGEAANANYFVSRMPLVVATTDVGSRRKAANSFSVTSYTLCDIHACGNGFRWPNIASGVTFFNENTEAGAQNGGVTAIQAGLSAWTNDPNSNVNYNYGGSDSGHTSGLGSPDGRNTVQFDRNLTAYGAAAFTCSPSSYSGVLGIGGVTNASGTHSYNSETFFSTTEGDVEMNQGIANCTLLLTTNAGDWNSALTHEIGHTLGFRHSDQTRDGGAACASDPSLECANVAIMRSAVNAGLSASLQTYDQHAVAALYGSCTPPGISVQPNATPATIASGGSSTLSVTATGSSPSYQWYIGSPGNTSQPVGTNSNSISVSPTSTTSYWVRVSGTCGTPVDSNGVTVTVTACTAPGISSQPQAAPASINPGNSSTLSVTATGSATLSYQWYLVPVGNTSQPVGTNSSSISVSPNVDTSYWVRVTNGCGSIDSNSVRVTVTASCVPASIQQQPIATPSTISTGQSSQISVVGGGTGPLSYQWYVGTTGNTGTPVPGGTNAQVSVSPTTTTNYWVRITNACGQADSNSATVTFSNGCAPPNVLVQPQDQTVTPGQVSLFVGYTGTSGNVNWYQGTAPDTSHFVGSGQNLQINVTQTTQFWAQITNNCGVANTRTATITVTQSCTAPGVTSINANPTTVAPSAASVLTVVATGTSLSYQWYRGNAGDTSNPIGGATSSTTTVNPTTTTSYWVRITNSCGQLDSVKVTVTVSTQCTAPTITTQPLSNKITAGQKLTLSVIANGAPVTYQWYQGPVDNTDSPIGTNSSNVEVQPLITASFWVKVTNSCGDAKSNAAVITVNPAKRRAVGR